jgi:hypothetical protein
MAVMVNLLLLAMLLMPIQEGCNAAELGLQKIGTWSGQIPNADSPNEVKWELTLYGCKAHPDMPAAYLIINHSYTLRSNVAARPVALPGKKNGKWMEFLFPTKEVIKVRRLAGNRIEILQETSGKKFFLSKSDQSHDFVIYGESCEEWKRSLKDGRWSEQLWP